MTADVVDLVGGLNEEQMAAVFAPPRPTVVSAGAGSGKTRVLTARIANQVISGVVAPDAMFVSAFTKTAAQEMNDRLRQFGISVEASTFHSHMWRLGQAERRLAGHRPVQVCTDGEKATILKMICGTPSKGFPKALKLTNPDVAEIGRIIAAAKNNLVSVDDFDPSGFGRDGITALDVYRLYEAELSARHKIDFDDMLFDAWRLLNRFPDALARARNRWQAFHIDEAQDTNYAQWAIIQMLAPAADEPNLTIVGDVRQCIPSGQMVCTPGGPVPIERVSVGDEVMSSVAGNLRPKRVTRTAHAMKASVMEFTTSTGNTFRATPDHMVFGSVPVDSDRHYVYLMWRDGYGFRVGTHKPCGGISRTNMERADRLWILDSAENGYQARRREHQIAYRYGIPMAPFKLRKGTMFNSDEEVVEFFAEFKDNGFQVLSDFGLDFHRPPQLAKPSNSGRRTVNICVGAKGGTQVNVESKHVPPEAIDSFGFTQCADGTSRYRHWFTDAHTAFETANALAKMLDASEAETLSVPRDGGRRRVFTFPAAGLHVGMLVPEPDEHGSVRMVPIVSRTKIAGRVRCHDLEVAGSANFVVGGVVVHNCIFQFRGSTPEHFDGFERRYPGATRIDLTVNYRSVDPVIAAANNLVTQLGEPDLQGSRGAGDSVEVNMLGDDWDQAEWIAQHVKGLRAGGTAGGDIAVLARTNSQFACIERALVEADVPYMSRGGGFFSRMEVGDAVAYLRLALGQDDVNALSRIINRPTRYLGKAFVDATVRQHRRQGVPLLEALTQVRSTAQKSLSSNQMANAKTLQALLRRLGTLSPSAAIEWLLTDGGYRAWVLKEAVEFESDNATRTDNFDALKKVAARFATISEFLSFVTVAERSLRESGDSVEITTIHGAKGREWDVVIVAGVTDHLLPHHRSEEDHERRLAYVAFTRARDMLHLCVTSSDPSGEPCGMSPFIADARVHLGAATTIDELLGDDSYAADSLFGDYFALST